MFDWGQSLLDVRSDAAEVSAVDVNPIMVTPYSQFMGALAVMNVFAGERYKIVSDEIIQFALGFWGEDERDALYTLAGAKATAYYGASLRRPPCYIGS